MATHPHGGGAGDDEKRRNDSSSSSTSSSSTRSAAEIQAYPTHRHLDIYPSHASNGILENNQYLHSLGHGVGATDDWATYDSKDPVPSISLDIHATLDLPFFDNTAHDRATATLPDPSRRSRDSLAWPQPGRRSPSKAIAAGDTQPIGVTPGKGGAVESAPGAEGEKHWSFEDMSHAEEEEQNRQRKVEGGYLKPIVGEEADGDGDVVMTDEKGAQQKDSSPHASETKVFPATPDPERRVLEFGPHWELISGPLPHSTAIIKHYLDNRQPVDIDRLRDFLEHVSASMPSPEAFDQFIIALRMWITRQISYEALVDWLVYFFSAKPDLLERSNVLLGTIAKLTSSVVEPERGLAGDAGSDLATPTTSTFPAATSGDKVTAANLRPEMRGEESRRSESRSGSGSGASSTTPSTDTGHCDLSQRPENVRSPSSISDATTVMTSPTGSEQRKTPQSEADERAAVAARASNEPTPSPPPNTVEIDIVYSCPLGVYRRRIMLDQPS